jgi:hypothetical protein
MRAARQELRHRSERVRRDDELRFVRDRSELRRQWHAQRLRMHTDNVRGQGRNLRGHLRRVRKDARVRQLYGSANVRWQRSIERMRLRSKDVRAARQELRQRPRWLRRNAFVRIDVSIRANVRRWWQCERMWSRSLPTYNVRCARQKLRIDFKRMWHDALVWLMQRSANVRRRRH